MTTITVHRPVVRRPALGYAAVAVLLVAGLVVGLVVAFTGGSTSGSTRQGSDNSGLVGTSAVVQQGTTTGTGLSHRCAGNPHDFSC